MITRRGWPSAAIIFMGAMLIPGFVLAQAETSGVPEEPSRYGAPVDLSPWEGAPDARPPVRTSTEDTEPTPLGRMVTWDRSTAATHYSNSNLTGLDPDALEFVRGTLRPDAALSSEKNFSSYSLVPDPTLPEYRDKVKLYMRHYTATDSLYLVGSGTLIGPRTVLTAGHCVFLTEPDDWAHEIIVVPAYHNEVRPYGSANMVRLHSWEGWTESQDWDHDIGVIELDRPVGALTGWEGYGYDGDCDFFTSGNWVHSDYPTASPFDGETMQTETGRYDGCEIFGNEVYYDRPGYGGASGGGNIKEVDGWTVVWAVRSNTDAVLDNSWDTRLTSTKFGDIRDWIDAQETPDKDFEPLDATLAANTAVIGDPMPDLTFMLHNNGSGTWQGVVDYDIYISTDRNISALDTRLGSYSTSVGSIGADSIARSITVTPSTIPLTLSGGDYFVGVQVTTPDWDASNNETDGQDAAHLRLTCGTVPGTALTGPADGTTCLDPVVTLDWEPAAGAAYYEVDLLKFGGGTTYLSAAYDSLTVTSIAYSTQYSWRVRAYGPCGDIGPWTDYWVLRTRSVTPETPVLESPDDAATCVPNFGILLDWSHTYRAAEYVVRIGTVCGSGSFYNTSDSELTVNGLAGGTEYFWTVQGRSSCGEQGPWSICRSFRTAPSPGTIAAARQPFYDQENLTLPVLLNWDELASADKYLVQVWEEGIIHDSYYAEESEHLLVTLQPERTYEWRVQAVSDCGAVGPWTPMWPFHTIGPGMNLTLAQNPGWPQPVMPRSLNNATVGEVPLPVALLGDTATTWWNLDGVSAGEVGTGFFANHVQVDGAYADVIFIMNTEPGETFPLVNRGPINVRGGRHTFGGFVDAGGNIVETDEGDNRASKQWVWQSTVLSPDTAAVRTTPPDMTGGHESLPEYDLLWANCDGLRVTATGWWNAFVVHEPTGTADYDAALYPVSTGPTVGFEYFRGASLRPPGCTDAVLVNTNVTGNRFTDYDLGVYGQAGTGDYHARHVTSSGFPYGGTGTVSLGQDEMLFLREVYVANSDTGLVSVMVDVDPGAGPVHVNWMDLTFEYGGLLNHTATTTTDSLGHAALNVPAPVAGYYCVAVYRDATAGTGPMDVTLRIGALPPDLVAVTRSGWYAPIVPASGPDFPFPFTLVDAPSVLIGDTLATHYYAHVFNDSPTPVGSYDVKVSRDGAIDVDYTFPSLDAGQGYSFQGNFLTFPGGLHTISLELDPSGTVFESWDSNNSYGEQWAWRPLVQEVGVPGFRNTPPAPDGGRETLPSGVPVFDNCDGIRTPYLKPGITRSWAVGMAIVPVSGVADYDMSLYSLSDDPATAFRNPLAVSANEGSQTEFVVIRQYDTTEEQWDVGVVRKSGSGSYIHETVSSKRLLPEPIGDYGPVTMAPNELMDVYEARLDAGMYTFTVRNDSGTVDWGLSVYSYDAAYFVKGDELDDGATRGLADDGGPGADEQVSLQIHVTSIYDIAVWKKGSADAGKGGVYTFRIDQDGLSPVANDPEMPPVSALDSIRPNPFNPMTTIGYSLAAAGPVEIAIYDLRGRRVRSLLDETRPAGRHDVVWSGRDDRGRQMVSGIYFVRLRTGNAIDTRKISLVR